MASKKSYPAVYKHKNLINAHPNLKNYQHPKLNKIILKLYDDFKEYANRLDIVTDHLEIKSSDKIIKIYVIDGKIIETSYDSTVPIKERPIGDSGPLGIFFSGNEREAKKLFNKLEKFVSEKEIDSLLLS